MLQYQMALRSHEHKEAEQALHKSEDNYRLLVENIREVIYQTDTKGIVTYVSPAIEALTGFSQAEVEGRHFSQFIFKDDFERIVMRFDKALTGQTRATEYRILKKSGECVWVRTFSTPIRQADEVLGLQGVLSDISDLKALEAGLREREKELSSKTKDLEEMNAALRVLLETRQRDKTELEETVLFNIKELINPYVEKLKKTSLDDKQATYLNILESNLKNVAASFSHALHFKYASLTPAEIQIADLIRDDKTTKEIADLLNLSTRTIESHRKNIRRKMGLTDKKMNLRTTLLTIK
jgi:PAS domain S-box-containing protein